MMVSKIFEIKSKVESTIALKMPCFQNEEDAQKFVEDFKGLDYTLTYVERKVYESVKECDQEIFGY